MMDKKKHLVVLSGGQDSTICLYKAIEQAKDSSLVQAITFDYGQRHRNEIYAAQTIAKLANVKCFRIVNIKGIMKSRSPLLSEEKLEQYKDNKQMEQIIGDRIELTFVPMRNPLFLTIAINHAVHNDCKKVWIGVCQNDNANYPDCTAAYINAMQSMIYAALGEEELFVDIQTPLICKSKHHAIRDALQLPGCYRALAYSHTSYAGDYPPYNRNHATVLREESFCKAGIPDPLILRAVLEQRMPIPDRDPYKDLPQEFFQISQRSIDEILILIEMRLRETYGYC